MLKESAQLEEKALGHSLNMMSSLYYEADTEAAELSEEDTCEDTTSNP